MRRLLLVLAMPSLAMAFSTTVVSTYVPVVARRQTSSALIIGVIVAGEGIMAMWVPLLAGGWSDRFRERGGSRLSLVAAGAPVFAAGLIGLTVARSPLAIGLLVAVFFAGNFLSYEPYRALYPDLLEGDVAGRAQAGQAVSRGLGTILALAGGGLLLSVWLGLPFIVAAVLQTATIAALIVLLPRVSEGAAGRRTRPNAQDLVSGARGLRGRVAGLVRGHPELRLYLLANTLWELSLGALKTFVVLYVTVGLGHSLSAASLIIGLVAIVILLGAVVSGKLGDRWGKILVMRYGLWLFGLTLLVPVFTRSTAALLAAVPVIAFGGGLTMTLPYAILMPIMPEDSHGMMTGFYSLSRGLGVMLGPLLAGLAVQLLGGEFASTHGYAAVWIVVAGAILLSIPVLGRLRDRLPEKTLAAARREAPPAHPLRALRMRLASRR
jgi:MFS family permease